MKIKPKDGYYWSWRGTFLIREERFPGLMNCPHCEDWDQTIPIEPWLQPDACEHCGGSELVPMRVKLVSRYTIHINRPGLTAAA